MHSYGPRFLHTGNAVNAMVAQRVIGFAPDSDAHAARERVTDGFNSPQHGIEKRLGDQWIGAPMPAGADIDVVICSYGRSLPGATVSSRNHPELQLFDVHLEAPLGPNHNVVAQVFRREVALCIRRPDPILQFKNDDMIVFHTHLFTKHCWRGLVGT